MKKTLNDKLLEAYNIKNISSNKLKVVELFSSFIEGSPKNIYLYMLGSPIYKKLFEKKYPKSKVYMIEDITSQITFGDLHVDWFQFVNIQNKEYWPKKWQGNNMKFDYIIMNPPYSNTLHLEILNEVKTHSQKIISLQPCRVFFNFIEATKLSRKLSKLINSIEEIPMEVADRLFNIAITSELGIIQIDKNKSTSGIDFKYKELETIYFKLKTVKSWRSSCQHGEFEYCLPMQGDSGYYKKCKLTPLELLRGNPTAKLVFNNDKEIENFKQTLSLWPYKICYILDGNAAVPAHMPFMGNEINPRTGLKGYESEWTDEDFYKFFDLTNDEIKIIEDTMKKYEV